MYSNITLQTNTNTPTPTGKCLLTESLVYARTSGAVFVYALHRFAGEASVREFASRYAKVGLSVFMQCEVQHLKQASAHTRANTALTLSRLHAA